MFKSLFKAGPRYTLKQAVWRVALSVFLTGGAFGAFFFLKNPSYHHHDDSLTIQKILQSGFPYPGVNSCFFAEVLGLSIDQPVSLSRFDANLAREKLYQWGLFKTLSIQKIKPDMLYIEYRLREPLGVMKDVTNTLFDEEGMLFPSSPFFTPKKLPEVFFGTSSIVPGKPIWGHHIEEEKMKTLRLLKESFNHSKIRKIDLSFMQAPSLGQRQILVVLDYQQGTHTLRLPVKHLQSAIRNYFNLLKDPWESIEKTCIIDLRLSSMAYLNREESALLN